MVRTTKFETLECDCLLVIYLTFVVGEYSSPNAADPIAMMEYYMKKAAAEEKTRPPKSSKDEMPPPASLQGLYFSC